MFGAKLRIVYLAGATDVIFLKSVLAVSQYGEFSNFVTISKGVLWLYIFYLIIETYVYPVTPRQEKIVTLY